MLKLSSSSIGTFEKCPKQYHYRYIEKPDIEILEKDYLEFGKCAHRVLELFHEDLCENIRDPSEYASVMKKSFKSALKEFDLDILRPELGFLRDILQSYLRKIRTEGLPEVVSNELEFKFELGGYIVRGYIDRIDRVGPGEYMVVDYKTNKNPKYLTSFQLILYAIAIKKKFPDAKKITGKYILLKHDCKDLNFVFTKENYKSAMEKIKRVGKSIETNTEWVKKPTRLCNWCDYQSICQNNWTD